MPMPSTIHQIAHGIDDHDFVEIQAYGLEWWLDELAFSLKEIWCRTVMNSNLKKKEPLSLSMAH